MSEIIIEVRDLCKSFGSQNVLKDINLHLESGKIYGIVGYNGSGKSVFFKCLCGFYHADQGSIEFNGKKLGKDMDLLPETGILIEEPGYIKNMSGYQNLSTLYNILNKPNRTAIINAMENVGLDPHSKKPVSHYSLGMKQRLAIAQATMEDQKILILDEPMNGLDFEGILQMRDFFTLQKEKGKLILLASHNREDIEVLCDEVYQITAGKLKKLTE